MGPPWDWCAILVRKAGGLKYGHEGALIGRIQGDRAVDYITRFIEKHRYGRWKEILLGYAILCLLSGVASAWGSRHFLSSFALWTLAHALYLPVLFACLGLSIGAGIYVSRISRLAALGWIVGITALVVFSWTIVTVVGDVPGIGWRFLAIFDHQPGDY